MTTMSKKEKQLTAKRISETLKDLEKWMTVCDEGKPVIQEILAAKKELTKEKEFSHQLQNSCDRLYECLPKFKAILVSLEALHEKLQSVHELSNLSTSSQTSLNLEESFAQDTIGQVVFHHEKIISHLRSQFQVLNDVVENIGTADTFEKSVFLACCWTMQPHLDDDYFIAIEFLKGQN